jgi:small-conductance mechanosensitive channel
LDQLFHHDAVAVGDWTLSLILLSAWLLVGFAGAWWFFQFLKKRSLKASQPGPSVMAKALPIPFYLLLVVSGFMLSSRYAPFLEADENQILRVLRVLLLLALVYLADNLLQAFLRQLEGRHDDLKNSRVFFSALIHIAVWILGAMLLLDHLGVSITPLLASLGVGSLAVALGFQSTFANLFSGVYLLIDKPVQVGHYVKLSTGQEGFVEVIGWRSTRIRTLSNHLVILPNSQLAENLIQNYSRPGLRCPLSVEVGVDYASDLRKVEEVTVDVARQVQEKAPGASRDYQPSVSFHAFASSAVKLAVNLEAQQYTGTFGVKHEFIKALHERYRREGIVMPFPIQTVEFRGPIPTEKIHD